MIRTKAHNEKIGDSMRGKLKSDAHKDNIRQAALKRPKKHCPHCGRDIAINIYAKYHGDNCKMNPDKDSKSN